MTDTARARKLADRIRVVVAETLDRRIKDPRLGFVTITDTRVTGDLREATVFYTVFGDETEREASAAALESAKGVLRSEVGRQTGVRHTPSLAFVLDAVPDNARAIDDLLAKARAADEQVRSAAAGATYAGEADPYRAPAEDEEAEAADAGDAGDAADAADAADEGGATDPGGSRTTSGTASGATSGTTAEASSGSASDRDRDG